MSKFDPETLAKLPEEYRGVVTEEIARLSKMNADLKEENEEIADTIYSALFQAEEDIDRFHGHLAFGPFYFSYMANEISTPHVYMTISDGCLSIELTGLCFTFGVIIPVSGGNEDDEDDKGIPNES